MKLKIPYFKQTNNLNCGPTALRMVLSYFGRDEDIEALEKRMGVKEGKGISTIQIATAATSFGYKTDFYSKHLLFDEENLKHEFYKKYGDHNLLNRSKKLVEDAKNIGVNIHEKKLLLGEILELINKDCIFIVLLDWNIVENRKEKGYQGHFVPIVGFDDQNVYVHNPGFNESTELKSIPRLIFDEARKSDGTDEDILIVYRKK